MKLIPTYSGFRVLREDGSTRDYHIHNLSAMLRYLWRRHGVVEICAPSIIPGYPPSPEFLKKWFPEISTRELATKLYPGITFDTALPQQWVNAQEKDPRGRFVWGYPDGSVMGQPLPLISKV